MSKTTTVKNNIIGKKYNRLTVLEEFKEIKNGRHRTYLKCECDCGEIVTTRKDNVINGNTKSCGCYAREKSALTNKTHGMSETRFYKTWRNMKSRCQGKYATGYENYGGRGITVCDRWNKFENFYDDMYESYLKHVEKYGEDNTSIDRINNNGNYEPNNCRWTNQTKQTINRRERSDNTSGHTGVSWNKLRNKWMAFINLGGKQKHIGYFTDKKDAIKARQAYEARHYNTTQIDGATYDINLLAANFYAKKE